MENETAVVLVYKELETVASMWSLMKIEIHDSGMVCVELDKVPLLQVKTYINAYYLSIDTTYITTNELYTFTPSSSRLYFSEIMKSSSQHYCLQLC